MTGGHQGDMGNQGWWDKRKRRRRKNPCARDRQDQSSIEGSTRVPRGPKKGLESIMEWKWAPSGQNFEVADMRTRGELEDEGPHSWNPISSRKHPLASFLHSEAKKTTSFSSQSRNCPDFQQNLFPYLLERYLINGSFVWSLISYFALNYESPHKS